jgi:hypothetical protein
VRNEWLKWRSRDWLNGIDPLRQSIGRRTTGATRCLVQLDKNRRRDGISRGRTCPCIALTVDVWAITIRTRISYRRPVLALRKDCIATISTRLKTAMATYPCAETRTPQAESSWQPALAVRPGTSSQAQPRWLATLPATDRPPSLCPRMPCCPLNAGWLH